MEGIKETINKLDYSEINFELFDLMAKRFNDNKTKYPLGNGLKKIEVRELEQALFRHVRKLIQPTHDDPETYIDHLAAIGCNISLILNQQWQLK